MAKKVYLMDTNALSAPNAQHYCRLFCPAYWDWLQDQIQADVVTSIEEVRNELVGCEPSLAEWIRNEGSSMFTVLPAEVFLHHDEIVWDIRSRGEHGSEEVSQFENCADSWLIAYALYLRERKPPVVPHIVTYEVKAPRGARIKIPDVCARLEIGCVRPDVMLRQERALFVQGKREE